MRPLTDIIQASKLAFQSKCFPWVTSEAQAVTVAMAGEEMGIPVVTALREIQLIKGRIALSAGLVASRIKASEHYDYEILELSDVRCVLRFYSHGKPLSPDVTFGLEDAKKAGLLSNPVYQKFPRNMYFSRALMNGARWFCADVFSGSVYTPDELQTTDTQEPPPSFELKAVNEKTLTHYDGKLSNGKGTEDYTTEKLKQLLTTASTRKKLSVRDIELIEDAIKERDGTQKVSSENRPVELSGGFEVADCEMGADVRGADGVRLEKSGQRVSKKRMANAHGPLDASGDATAGTHLDESSAGVSRSEASESNE